MNANIFWIGLVLFASSCCMAIGDDGENSYRIVSERMPAKAGDEVELLAESLRHRKTTGKVNGREIAKTEVEFSQLKAKVRIVRWDATNEFGMVEFDVEHLIKGDGSVTNKLLADGDRVIATYIGGQSFYKSPERILASEARQLMDQLSERPIGIKSGKRLAVTKEACKLGDCWIAPLESLLDEGDEFNLDGLTNALMGTQCFVGLTNVFDTKCFRIGSSMKLNLKALPSSLFRKFLPMDRSVVEYAEGEIQSEISYPFDVALPPLVTTYAMSLRGRFSRDGNLAEIEGNVVNRFIYKPLLKSEKH